MSALPRSGVHRASPSARGPGLAPYTSTTSRGARSTGLSSSEGSGRSSSSSKLPLRHSVNTLCHLGAAVCLNADKRKANNHDGASRRNVDPKIKSSTFVFRSEDRKCSISLSSSTHHTHTHARARSVPTLGHCDTDGANMRDVSGVARERYLWPR